MEGVTIVNNTGLSGDTKIIVNGVEIQNCVTKVELLMEPGEIIKAKLTLIVQEIISEGELESVEIKQIGLD